jgi:hypothetical protein
LDDGLGIAIFGDPSRADGPQWVFTYGDVLSYSLYGQFDGNPPGPNGVPSAAAEGEHQILRATPSDSYLPVRARRSLGRYMRDVFHHPDPKVALIVDPHLNPARNLMVNLTLDQYDGESDKLDAAVRYLTWFIPRSYSLMALPTGWDDSGFVPLE